MQIPPNVAESLMACAHPWIANRHCLPYHPLASVKRVILTRSKSAGADKPSTHPKLEHRLGSIVKAAMAEGKRSHD